MTTQLDQQWLEETRKFWDTETAFQARYRRICSDPEIDACENEAELQKLWDKRTAEELPQLLDGIPIQQGWVCLEIGCGIGRLMKPIARRCARVIGVDLSPNMVHFAERYLADTPNATVRLNDGKSIPEVDDASIDWMYSHLAFQHITLVEVVEKYLTEIHRVLKPGGYCRIQCWREGALPISERAKNVGRRILGRPVMHVQRHWQWQPGRQVKFNGVAFHPAQWRRMLRAHGFDIVDLTTGVGHDCWMWTTARKPA